MSKTFRIINGDVSLDARTGRPEMIEGKEKLRQDLKEMLEVEVQPSGFGAGLESLVGLVTDVFRLKVELTERVSTAVDRLMDLQMTQAAARPASERIVAVQRIEVAQIVPPNTVEPSKTVFGYRLDVQTAENAESVSQGGAIIG